TETAKPQGLSGRTSAVSVDGIYADPIIMNDKIFYGTRNMFLARDVVNGHELWENRAIKTYSAFPTYYDNMIITQSMDYATGLFTVHASPMTRVKPSGSAAWKNPCRYSPRWCIASVCTSPPAAPCTAST
ncbi:MAG TPA: hypothetical protein PLG31_16440, partial [Spirochaetota bacterium]|nr:hypothetical protein [Spirochaetota bacterium]